MPITIDQPTVGTRNVTSGSTATFTLTTSGIVAAGALVIFAIATSGSTAKVTSCSGGGLTWTVDRNDGRSAAQGGLRWNVLSAPAPSGLAVSTVITPAWDITDSPIPITCGALSILGAKKVSPLDVADPTGGNGNSFASTNAWSANPATTTAPGDIIIAFSMGNGSGSTPTSPALEAFEILDVPDDYSLAATYRIEPAAGTYTVAGSYGGAASTVSTFMAAYQAEPVMDAIEVGLGR